MCRIKGRLHSYVKYGRRYRHELGSMPQRLLEAWRSWTGLHICGSQAIGQLRRATQLSSQSFLGMGVIKRVLPGLSRLSGCFYCKTDMRSSLSCNSLRLYAKQVTSSRRLRSKQIIGLGKHI